MCVFSIKPVFKIIKALHRNMRSLPLHKKKNAPHIYFIVQLFKAEYIKTFGKLIWAVVFYIERKIISILSFNLYYKLIMTYFWQFFHLRQFSHTWRGAWELGHRKLSFFTDALHKKTKYILQCFMLPMLWTQAWCLKSPFSILRKLLTQSLQVPEATAI